MGLCCAAVAQTTIATGSIQGTVTDPLGAVVPFSTVTITNTAMGGAVRVNTTQSGTYSSGALLPGKYVVRVEARNFATQELPVVVDVAVTASGNVRVEIGPETRVMENSVLVIRVNTEQATIQGIIDTEQIEQLPIGIGRKFSDLAQL